MIVKNTAYDSIFCPNSATKSFYQTKVHRMLSFKRKIREIFVKQRPQIEAFLVLPEILNALPSSLHKMHEIIKVGGSTVSRH